jgi:hypothetical protein
MNTSSWSNNWMSFFICFEWSNELLWVCQEKLYITYFHFGRKGTMKKNHKPCPNHNVCFPNKTTFKYFQTPFFPPCLLFVLDDPNNYGSRGVLHICLFNSKGKKEPLKIWTCWNHNVWTCLSPNLNFLLLYP